MIMIVLVIKIILKENHKKKSIINLMEKSTPIYYDIQPIENMEFSKNDENNESQISNDSGDSLDVNLDKDKSLNEKLDSQNDDKVLSETLDNLLEKMETSTFSRPNVNDADDFMCDRMSYSSIQSKHAINNRAKYNKYSIMPYFDSELRANEERDWWDRETDYLDAFM